MSFAVVKPVAVADGTFTRASTAWYYDSTGTLQSAANNVLRVGYDPATLGFSGVIFEPNAITNLVRNGAFTGITPGSPGTPPTNSQATGAGGSVTSRTIGAATTESGIDCFDITWTTTGSIALDFKCESSTGIAALPGQTWYAAISAKISAGTAANLTNLQLFFTEYDIGGTALGNSPVTTFVAPSNTNLRANQYAASYTTVNANCKFVTFTCRVTTNGAVTGLAMRYGLPHLVLGSAPSFLSPVKTAGADVTRAADTLPSGMTSDISATDYPAIAGTHAYVIGDRVQEGNSVYQCTAAYTSAGTPVAAGLDPTHWLYFSPTKRWAPFDTSISTQASKATSLSYVIKPDSTVSAVAVLNTADTSVRCRMIDSTGVLVYDNTKSLTGTISAADYWNYCFETVIRLDQSLFLDMPPYGNGSTLLVDVYSASATAKVGVVMLGYQIPFTYGIKYGAHGGITDYSRKDTDIWGNTILDQRAYSKRRDWALDVKNTEIDALEQTLISLRAIPCLWVGYSGYSATTVFGFYKDFDINIQYSTMAECTLQLEGMT